MEVVIFLVRAIVVITCIFGIVLMLVLIKRYLTFLYSKKKLNEQLNRILTQDCTSYVNRLKIFNKDIDDKTLMLFFLSFKCILFNIQTFQNKNFVSKNNQSENYEDFSTNLESNQEKHNWLEKLFCFPVIIKNEAIFYELSEHEKFLILNNKEFIECLIIESELKYDEITVSHLQNQSLNTLDIEIPSISPAELIFAK